MVTTYKEHPSTDIIYTPEQSKKIQFYRAEIMRTEKMLERNQEILEMFKAKKNDPQAKMMALAYEGNEEGFIEKLKELRQTLADYMRSIVDRSVTHVVFQLPFIPCTDMTRPRLLEVREHVETYLQKACVKYHCHGQDGLSSLIIYSNRNDLRQIHDRLYEMAPDSFLHNHYQFHDTIISYDKDIMAAAGVVMHDPIFEEPAYAIAPPQSPVKEIEEGWEYQEKPVEAFTHPFMVVLLKRYPELIHAWRADVQHHEEYYGVPLSLGEQYGY